MATININVDGKIKEQAKNSWFSWNEFYKCYQYIIKTNNLNWKHSIWNKSIKIKCKNYKSYWRCKKGIRLSKGYTNLDKMWKDLEKDNWYIC